MRKPNSLFTDQFLFCLQYTQYLKKNHIQTVKPVFVDNKFIYNSQHGFREDHSTEFATLELVHKITLLMNKMNS